MHLLEGLAFAYQAKPEDLTVEWLAENQRVRRVIKQVTSSFWFLREVMQYAPDCFIVSPAAMRDRLASKLRTLCQLYNIETRD